jgi:hypothetical protein
MTEQEWLVSTDARRMLESISDVATHRKLILLSVNCWSPLGEMDHNDWGFGESIAEGADSVARLACLYISGDFTHSSPTALWLARRTVLRYKATDAELAANADLLRDIFGNPFRPVAFAPEWRTDTAIALARTMYESREFSAMPILADALQDAGCDSDDVLSHCREPGDHVRGCWVVDLVLGRE